jgi:hypothetical protein
VSAKLKCLIPTGPPLRNEIVPSSRLDINAALKPVLLAVSILTMIESGDVAQAQGKLEANYAVTLASFPIGKGRWTIDIADDQFTATAIGATAGMLRVFASGDGNSAARGAMIAGVPSAASFTASVTADKRTEEFRMTLDGGDVKDYSVLPEPEPNPERVPLTDAHRRGVKDPMTASLIQVPGNANLLGPEACQRTLAVFDGRMRYDLKLSYKRVDEISAEKGYSGPAVVCAINFVPLAGYNPHRSAIKYLINSRDIELWLAPIAGTRILVPFRVSIPTPIGVGIMQATEFVSASQPPRATASTAKAQ